MNKEILEMIVDVRSLGMDSGRLLLNLPQVSIICHNSYILPQIYIVCAVVFTRECDT
jgi:hypothetical protein